MKLRAFVAVMGLLGACAAQPDLNNHPPHAAEITPSAYHSQQGLYFKVVDDGSTYMQQLYDHVQVDHPAGVSASVDRRRFDGRVMADYSVTGPTPDVIKRYVASDASLAVPADRELAFERVDVGRWRAVLLVPTVELDGSAIAHAEASTDPNTGRPLVMVDLTPAEGARFGQLTARIAGHKLAILVDGTVVSSPIIRDEITAARASITLGQWNTLADAQALAASLEPR